MDPADVSPVASVIIPARNASSTIAEQLDALLAQDTEKSFEILVVDNGSTDDTAAIVATYRAHSPNVRIVSAPERRGLSYVRNTGARFASAELLLFCDADDRAAPGWVAANIEALGSADLVGGHLAINKLNDPVIASWDRGRSVEGLPVAYRFLPYATGASLGVRAAVHERIQGFDERYIGGHEEVDYCWRAQLAGYAIAYAPGAVMHYRLRPTLRKLAEQHFRYGRSSIVLLERWSGDVNAAASLGSDLVQLIWIFINLPLLAVRSERGRVVRVAALQLGRWWGRASRVAGAKTLAAAIDRALLYRLGRRSIVLDRLLLGGQGGDTGASFAQHIGDLRWTSTPFSEGPHVSLLASAKVVDPTDAQILGSQYAHMARHCIAAYGSYFWARDDAGIVEVARDFIERGNGRRTERRSVHQSSANSSVKVAPIEGSSLFQIIDGHHRLAIDALRGATHARVEVARRAVRTALQEHLTSMTWIGGAREFYQPLDAPELVESWSLVRQCTDRFDAMAAFLRRECVNPPATYLDVACCYGWFVARFAELGFTASGVERDPLGQDVGRAFYHLSADAIATADAFEFLSSERQWDVVSCLSLLHHYVLGRAVEGVASVTAEEFVKALDRSTRHVLFLDTGQDDELWFRRDLVGWNPSYVASFLREHTTFDRIVDLGPDQDRRFPYERNYGRHLFACIRD